MITRSSNIWPLLVNILYALQSNFSCTYTRDSHNNNREPPITMNRNKYLIPLPFCHPHYRVPPRPSWHIWNSVQHYNVSKASFCNRIQIRGEFFKTLHQSELERPVLNFSLMSTDVYRRWFKRGYKSWVTSLKTLHCCQYLSTWLLAVTVCKCPYAYRKSLPSCTAAGSS